MTLALAGTGGCKKSTPPLDAAPVLRPPVLGTVAVEDRTPAEGRPEGAKLDTNAITAELRRALEGSGVFAARLGDGAPAGAGTARVRAEVVIDEAHAEGKVAARALVRLRVDVRPEASAPPRFHEDVQAGAETVFGAAEKPNRRELYQRLAARTVSDLASAYLGRQKLWAGESAAVRTALRGDAGDLRLEAIRAVAERRLRDEVPTLLALLEHPDETVRDAALGALVEMGDRRAVSVLTRKRDLKDRREMRKILDALSMLGGDEAADYLGFVAVSHEDEEIRAMAAQARDRLARRAGKKQ